MMNYDTLLSQLTDDKLTFFQGRSSNDAAQPVGVGVSVEDGAVEEEPVAPIRTVQLPCAGTSKTTVNTTATAIPTTITTTAMGHKSAHNKTETTTTTATAAISTPQRKISTSARFMNAFQHLYAGATNSNSTNATSDVEDSDTNNITAGRTPTKGMESKLLSMWHNVKYGWSGRMRSNFSKEQPVWLLGRCYHRKYTPPVSMDDNNCADQHNMLGAGADNSKPPALGYAANAYDSTQNVPPGPTGLYPPLNTQVDEIVVPQELGMDAAENQVAEQPWEEGIEGFRRDFYSRIWMTYRREFPIMNGSNYTSDCGWGCMLRSGQMLMAQGLICHFLGRSWRYDPDTQLHNTYEDNIHKKIIKWFGDSSSKTSPFSIHALVNLGEEMGKKPGDWYGPASVSYLLKQALKKAALENADFDNITIYVARDCTIYIQDVEDECCIREPSPKPHVPWHHTRKVETPKREKPLWKSLIILIPLRLGTEKLNPVYAHCLKLLLSTDYCIGIIGGRPKHSLYFVGFQEDKLIHLDPHYCQEMVDVNQENFSLHSFHCKSPRKLKTAKMDPSCCIGFYCQTKTDFDNFVESVQLYLHPMRCASGTIDRMIPPAQQLPNMAAANDAGNNQQYAEMNYPLFSFSRGRCQEHEQRNEMSDSYYKPLQQRVAQLQQELQNQFNNGDGATNTTDCSNLVICDEDDDDETEEFVLL